MNDKYPLLTTNEIIDQGDRLLASARHEQEVHDLRDWCEQEQESRQQGKQEFESADVDVEGGTLRVGNWYEVAIAPSRWSRIGRTTTWHTCLYVGRTRLAYRFRRIGNLKQARRDLADNKFWPSQMVDDVEHYRLASIERIELPADITAALIERHWIQ